MRNELAAVIAIVVYFLLSFMAFVAMAFYEKGLEPSKRKGLAVVSMVSIYWPLIPCYLLLCFVCWAYGSLYERIVSGVDK
ncbi:hypothetical protein [Pantoea sp. y20]